MPLCHLLHQVGRAAINADPLQCLSVTFDFHAHRGIRRPAGEDSREGEYTYCDATTYSRLFKALVITYRTQELLHGDIDACLLHVPVSQFSNIM